MASNGVVSCLRDVRPPVINYEPSIWGDTFSNSSFDPMEQQKLIEAIEALKQEAREGIVMDASATTPLKQMILIDTLERLGLAYHFETEIEQILAKIHINAHQDEDNDVSQDYDLFTASLQFRLLRQHQHHISCDVFDKFVDEDGKFEEALSSDVEGLLSLYEAAHVLFRDEKILQEAANFARHYLKRMEDELKSPLKEKVKRALKHPFHRDFPIVHARVYISIYEMDPSKNEILLKLAKFNFNFLQNLYKNELSQLSRWWNKFDLKSKIAFARDRVVEAYVWGVGYHYEPQYSYVRMGLAKGIQVIGVVDDFYDNYATLSEAQLFTEVLDRWNKDEADRLPDHMKIVYDFVLRTCQEYERDAISLGNGFAAPYFKETVQQLARAYNQELKWIMERQLPSFQDYIKNSEVTSCIFLMFASIIPGLKSVTQQTIDWLKTEPKLAISTGMIGRYWDDIGTHQRESKGGKMLTVMDCYMKQYGVTKQETLSKFVELVEEAWMDVNKEFVATSSSSSFVAKEAVFTFLNYARMCDATYNTNNGDAYTDPKIFKAIIPALFVDRIVT